MMQHAIRARRALCRFVSIQRAWLALLIMCTCHTASATPPLFGYSGGGTPAGIYEISTATGSATFVTPVQITPPAQLTTGGMALLGVELFVTNYTPAAGSQPADFYGVLDPLTGAFSPIGRQDTQNWQGLAANQGAGVLYAVPVEHGILTELTPRGALRQIGTGTGIGGQGVRGLAYDDANGVLYAAQRLSIDAAIYTINTTTGVATLLGNLGFNTSIEDVDLAFDEMTGTLYGVNAVNHQLFTINTTTGAAAVIGTHAVPFGSIEFIPEPSAVMCAVLAVAPILMGRPFRRSFSAPRRRLLTPAAATV